MVSGAVMVDHLFGITWAAPQNSLCFFIIALLVGIVIVSYYRLRNRISQLAAPEHQGTLIKNFTWRNYIVKRLLLSIALGCIGLALLRPQWDKKEEVVMQEGRDVIIALDISRSMLAQDYRPNRLEYAKDKIKKLVQSLDAERVGLLVFSGAAIMQCPLTTDYDAFMMFLDEISVETISSGTTSLGSALKKVIGAFSHFADNRTRLVALFTDGEDFSQDLSGIKQQAVDSGVHIFTLGVGTADGSPIPLYDEAGLQKGHQKDKEGHVVVSRLDGELIQKLSQETGGKYVHATEDDRDINALRRWVESFEKAEFAERPLQRLQEKYYYYSACALFLLLIEWIL